MQNFLSLWLNTGAQITHGGQVQRLRQKKLSRKSNVYCVDSINRTPPDALCWLGVYYETRAVPCYKSGQGRFHIVSRWAVCVCYGLFQDDLSPIAALLICGLQLPTCGQNVAVIKLDAINVRRGKSPSLMSMNYSAPEIRVAMTTLSEGMNIRRRY